MRRQKLQQLHYFSYMDNSATSFRAGGGAVEKKHGIFGGTASGALAPLRQITGTPFIWRGLRDGIMHSSQRGEMGQSQFSNRLGVVGARRRPKWTRDPATTGGCFRTHGGEGSYPPHLCAHHFRRAPFSFFVLFPPRPDDSSVVLFFLPADFFSFFFFLLAPPTPPR